jgi:hypothetical protein
VRFTLSVAIPMSMCLHMHTCTAHTTRIKSFVQIVTADAIVQNVTAVEGAEIQSRQPNPFFPSPQTRLDQLCERRRVGRVGGAQWSAYADLWQAA